jgi:hypothetical protein
VSRKRARRLVATTTTLAAIGLGVGLATPAVAAKGDHGRFDDKSQRSMIACDASHYQNASPTGQTQTNTLDSSNTGYCD